jgi:predicted nucleic acid-binding protein
LRREHSENKVLLDTKPLIKLFSKEQGWEDVEKLLLSIENGEIDASISVVTLTEIYYRYIHQKRPDLAKQRVDELRYATYVHKIGIDADVAVLAGELKGKYSIPISDAFIAAAAYLNESTVITDDIDFKKISEIKTLTEKEHLQRGT